MRIVYLGNKEVKADNVSGTGLVWTRGQIHDVEDPLKAEKLIAHKLIWADADKKYELLKELAPVKLEPRIHVIPKNSQDVFWDPFVIPVSEQMLSMLREKKVEVVFMVPENAAKYRELRFPEPDGETVEAGNVAQDENKTEPGPDVTVPQNTGPTPQAKETRAGLESGKKAARI